LTIFDRSAPTVQILLVRWDGDELGVVLDLRSRLISFEYEDTNKKLSACKITLDNRDLQLFDDEQGLMGGGMFRVSWGYPVRMTPPREIVIKKVRGFQRLQVEGFSRGVLLDRVEQTRAWADVKRSDVVREIAEANGFAEGQRFIQDTEIVYDTINQAAETDARLLRRLAQAEDFEFFVGPDGLHWHDPGYGEPIRHRWEYYAGRGTLQSISVESDLTKRIGRSRTRGVGEAGTGDTEQGQDATTSTTSRDTLAPATQTTGPETELVPIVIDKPDPETGQFREVIEFRERPVKKSDANPQVDEGVAERNQTATVDPIPPSEKREAKRRADTRFKRAERDSIKLSARVIGDPTIEAGHVVEIRGIGAWLSGKYYLREVKHTISARGYFTECRLSADGVNKAGKTANPKGEEAAQKDEPKDKGALDREGDGFQADGVGGDVMDAVSVETGQISFDVPK
jgi:phage protein D